MFLDNFLHFKKLIVPDKIHAYINIVNRIVFENFQAAIQFGLVFYWLIYASFAQVPSPYCLYTFSFMNRITAWKNIENFPEGYKDEHIVGKLYTTDNVNIQNIVLLVP